MHLRKGVGETKQTLTINLHVLFLSDISKSSKSHEKSFIFNCDQ